MFKAILISWDGFFLNKKDAEFDKDGEKRYKASSISIKKRT
jgi:hypothetical protein